MPKPKSKAKHRQRQLPNVMTGPQVQERLGRKRRRPVTHVTIVHLVEAGKLHRVGKAKQRGGGWLYDAAEVGKLAKTYEPQNNPVSITSATLTSKGRHLHAAKGTKKKKSESRVDDDALGWLTTVPSDDTNFKSQLATANIATIQAALRSRAVRSKKVKRSVLESRLRRLVSQK